MVTDSITQFLKLILQVNRHCDIPILHIYTNCYKLHKNNKMHVWDENSRAYKYVIVLYQILIVAILKTVDNTIAKIWTIDYR